MGHIYMLTSPSGKKYVGQTRNPLKNRLRNHCNPSSNCTALARAIKKYKGVYDNGTIANFDLVNFECPDDELDHYEQLLIRIYKTATKTKGYNLRSGGEGGSHTAETIEKIRQANLGKKHTAETRKKIGDANRNPTAETCAKMSKAQLGKKHTEETCAKIGKANLGKKRTAETRAKIGDANRKRAPPSAEIGRAHV